MGSSGGGSFTDYSGSTSSKTGGGSSGGSSGNDPCRQAFQCTLEEVALCNYYTTHGTVPGVGTPLTVIFNVRLYAVDSAGLRVGALPTSLNRYAACVKSGVVYDGIVTASTNSPVPSVTADFVPR